MKKLSLFILIIAFSSTISSRAQDQFSISQYYQTYSILNPGFAGVDDFLDIKLGYRKKWTGITDSPSTTFISAVGSIGDKTSYNQSPLRTSNPNQIAYIEAQKARIKYHGIGGFITKQEQGAFNQINLMLNYAYHIPLSTKVKFAMGTTLGIRNISVDINKLEVWDKVNDPVYQAYANGDGNYWRFLLGGGGVLYGKKSYFGISYMPVVDISLSNNDTDLASEEKVISMAGTKFNISPFILLQPSVLFESTSNQRTKLVGSILFDIKNLVKTGITYSNYNDVSINAMFNYKNEFGISYAFETRLGNETTIGNGSHEVILSLNLFNHLNATHRLW